jgi:hypothetical protein
MRKSKRSYYRSPYGVWLSDRDIKFYTPPDERKGYKFMAVGMGLLTLVFLVLWIAGVPELIPGAWAIFALLSFALLFVFVPMAWSRDLASRQPDIDFHAQLNPTRADNFWYERGVSDTPHFPDNQRNPDADAPIEPTPELQAEHPDEADSRRD